MRTRPRPQLLHQSINPQVQSLSSLEIWLFHCRLPSQTLVQYLTEIGNGRTCNQYLSEYKLLFTSYSKDQRLSELQNRQVTSAFVTSRLDCANGLLHKGPVGVIKKLERVQQSSARIVRRLHKYQRISMTEVLHELHWLPVASRIKYKFFIVTFKALRSGTPGYLPDLLLKPATIGHTRSQSTNAPDRLVVPWNSGERSAGTSYSVAAPKLWNSLPANIRNLKSLDTFKKHLKTHYFKNHYHGL